MISEKELKRLVGTANVNREPANLEAYSRDISFVNRIKPEFTVRVNNADEIQKLIVLAKETGTPLVPISSGPPHFRGDTVPSTGGAVMVDLSNMKKILWVNRENRVAMFEPGVTFTELIPAAAKEGLRLNIPLHPRRTKSVIGSLLDREPVIMPKYHWDIADPLAATEVIFGTGDRFRTGSAAGPGTIEEQRAAGGAQKEAAGPSAASWYRIIQGSQGTMGIVTWASARCELLPQIEEPFFAGSSKLNKILDILHWLIRLRLVNECLVINNISAASLMADKENFTNIKDSLPDWILFFNIAAYDYLPEERLKGQIMDMQEIVQRVGLVTSRALKGIPALSFLEKVRSPSAEPYWKLQRRGACEDIFFVTIYDKLDGLIKIMSETAKEYGYPASEIGIYLQPIVQGVNCHCEFNLFYDPENSRDAQRTRDLSAAVIRKLIAGGAFFSRPHGETARLIMNNDAATAATLKKIKSIVDPANILNPGKLCF
jgi:FAD/FMN-containing dehydrogenase